MLLLLAALGSGCGSASSPAGAHRAGLILVHGDGSVRTFCIRFEEPEISGTELLERAESQSVLDASNPMGVMVCSLDGEGCAFPEQPCLCACASPGSCTYWAYFARPPGEAWSYAALGPSMRRLQDGDLDAWVWWSGSTPGGASTIPVPDLTLERVCE